MSFCLTNVPYAAGPVTRWITVPDTTTNYVQFNDVSISNNFFQGNFPANSIQTFQIANVDMSPPVAPRDYVCLSRCFQPAQFLVSWPGWASNYAVYFATNLNSPVAWFPLTNQPQSTSGNIGVGLPVTSDLARFYRLRSKLRLPSYGSLKKSIPKYFQKSLAKVIRSDSLPAPVLTRKGGGQHVCRPITGLHQGDRIDGLPTSKSWADGNFYLCQLKHLDR